LLYRLQVQIGDLKGFDRAVLRQAVGDGEGVVHFVALVDVEPAVEQDFFWEIFDIIREYRYNIVRFPPIFRDGMRGGYAASAVLMRRILDLWFSDKNFGRNT